MKEMKCKIFFGKRGKHFYWTLGEPTEKDGEVYAICKSIALTIVIVKALNVLIDKEEL